MCSIKWAAKQIKEWKPVRRKSWDKGTFAGNDGVPFIKFGDPKTYQGPYVIVPFEPTLEDMLADDWVPVKIKS